MKNSCSKKRFLNQNGYLYILFFDERMKIFVKRVYVKGGCLMRRHFLSKKDRKRVLETIRNSFGVELVSEEVEVCLHEGLKIIIVDKEPVAAEVNGRLIPLLQWLLKRKDIRLPKIVVDKGAVKPISSGADVMAPGVVDVVGRVNAGDIAIVVDETYGMPIAVVVTLFSGDDIKRLNRGKVAENIHHVGDSLWKLAKTL